MATAADDTNLNPDISPNDGQHPEPTQGQRSSRVRYPRRSNTEVCMVIGMLREIRIEDEKPEDTCMYKFVKRIFPLEDSSVVSKTSVWEVEGSNWETHALKIITMHLTGTYDPAPATPPTTTATDTEENSSTSSTQGGTLLDQDEDMLDSLFQHCLEAVLQHDVFKHPNVLRVTDRWLYVPKESDGNAIVESIIKLLQFSSMPLEQRPGETLVLTEIVDALHEIKNCKLVLVMDHYESSLQYFFKISQQLQDQSYQIQKILYSTLHALDYIHNQGYIHLDLKPQNILVREKYNEIEVALADFGLARDITTYGSQDVDEAGRPGTFPYNHYPDKHYSKQVDIWALGLVAYYTVASIQRGEEITCYELVELKKDASEDYEGSFKSKLKKQINADRHQHHFIELIQTCLNPEPTQRGTLIFFMN